MKAGKPEHITTEKTRTEVQVLAGFGITQEEISLYIDVCPKTLRRHYRKELDTGVTRANAAMARRLYGAAMDEGSVAAMIFWLKARAGWSEKVQVELSEAPVIVFSEEDEKA